MGLKKYVLSTALSLTLLMPTAAAANVSNIQVGNIGSTSIATSARAAATELYVKPETELAPEVKAQITKLKARLKKGEITKEQFHQEMKKLLPEGSEREHKGHHKNLSDEDKAKLMELKTKLENGEIDKSEFIKQKKELFKNSPKQE